MQSADDLHKYEDIIYLPRHVSKVHPPMPISDRAAQFAPFAALKGFGDAIKKTELRAGARMESDENEEGQGSGPDFLTIP